MLISIMGCTILVQESHLLTWSWPFLGLSKLQNPSSALECSLPEKSHNAPQKPRSIDARYAPLPQKLHRISEALSIKHTSQLKKM